MIVRIESGNKGLWVVIGVWFCLHIFRPLNCLQVHLSYMCILYYTGITWHHFCAAS